MNTIKFEQVNKAYGKNMVVEDLNLEIREGERLVLLGPSGCGKSTILRMIAGLESITKGNLFLRGELVNEIPSGERDVAMVFQNYALYPHMTVKQNISYALKVHKMNKKELDSRIREVVEMLELTGLEDRKPKELSGGQRQRAALARSVVKRADYFLLDEPLSNLDAQLRVHARKELVKVHELYKPTFVYVTHDQVEAMTVGQRIALLNKGKLQMMDTPSNVYNKPANVFTAKFIGSPAANVVEVVHDNNALYLAGEKMMLSKEWYSLIENRKHLYFGIRPEHVKLRHEKTDNSIKGVVKYMEDYGNRIGVYFMVGNIEMLGICEENIFHPNETVYFEPDLKKIHLFDYETTNSLGYPTGGNHV